MERVKGKISLTQAMLLYLTYTYSSSMRVLVPFMAEKAERAAWLVQIPAFAVNLFFVWIFAYLMKKFPGMSFCYMLTKITGKVVGKILIVIYILWFLLQMALYTRYFEEKMTSTIYPNVHMLYFIIIMLILVGIVMRSGIVVLSRMNISILTVIVVQFALLLILFAPQVKVEHLTPITTSDIGPVLGAVVGPLGIWGYMFYILVFNDKINVDPKPFRKMLYASVFKVVADTSLAIMLLGIFGSVSLLHFSLPLLTATKLTFSDFAGLEALFLSVWTFADFVTIALYTYMILRLLKALFGLNEPMPLLGIVLVLGLFMTLLLCNDVFELRTFSLRIKMYVNVALGLLIPALLLGVGKIRRLC